METQGEFLCLFSLFIHIGKAICQPNPCNTYREINDTTMTLSFTLGPADSSICYVLTPDWYRFVGSTEGLLATECPSGTECGTEQQVWMQGPIPSYYNGITDVDICIRGNGDCCDRINRIQVKNCNSFVVYNLVSVPPCSRYCFNESSDMLVTVSTTSTTTTMSTTKPVSLSPVPGTNSNNTDESNVRGIDRGAVAGIVVGAVVFVSILAGVAFLVFYYKVRAHKVLQEPSNIR